MPSVRARMRVDAHRRRSHEDDDGEISAVRVADNEGGKREEDVDLDHGLQRQAGFGEEHA